MHEKIKSENWALDSNKEFFFFLLQYCCHWWEMCVIKLFLCYLQAGRKEKLGIMNNLKVTTRNCHKKWWLMSWSCSAQPPQLKYFLCMFTWSLPQSGVPRAGEGPSPCVTLAHLPQTEQPWVCCAADPTPVGTWAAGTSFGWFQDPKLP